MVHMFNMFVLKERKDKATGEIIGVNDGEAEFMLEILELLFDYYYVQSAKAVTMKDRWNEKF